MNAGNKFRLDRFAGFAWGVLGYNLLVILWGAFVRATGSGAGCGSHWPLCNGEIIPRADALETIVEFTHRLTSGLALILVVALFLWARRRYPGGDAVRLGARLSLIFIITEALVGAGLVLFEWVAQDTSVGRAISIVVHLINTFILLLSLALTAWWASGGKRVRVHSGAPALILGAGLAGALLMGASGALAALGDTLFPVTSLAEGIRQDFNPTAHFLVRLRLLHPTIAVLSGLWLIFGANWIVARSQEAVVRRLGRALVILVVVQIGAGFINVLLLAPVWMQLLHLLLADLIWITLVLFSAARFADQSEPAPENQAIFTSSSQASA